MAQTHTPALLIKCTFASYVVQQKLKLKKIKTALHLVRLIPFFLNLCSDYRKRIVPSHVVIAKGENVTLTCYSYSSPQWWKYEGRIKSHSTIHGNRLSMYNMGKEDQDLYACRGTDSYGVEFKECAVVLVGSKYYTHMHHSLPDFLAKTTTTITTTNKTG